MIQASLINQEVKRTPYDNNKGYYKNGEDNLYAEKQKTLIENSVTATTASSIMAQYLIGNGYGENDDLIVNSNKNINLYEFSHRLIKSKVDQKGYFIHIKYNAEYEISSLDVIPFEDCRVGKKDDREYSGKILVSKDFHNSKIPIQIIDVYNPDVNVIESQVRNSSGNSNSDLTLNDWSKYKGQILYVNNNYNYIYPLSRIHSVQRDCDSEYKSSLFKNRSLNNGNFGKTMFITPPLIDDDIEEWIYNDANELVPNPLYKKAVSERDNFKKTIESFYGAENTGGAVVLETKFDGEGDLDKAFVVKNIETNINDKLFEYTEKSTRRNILFAFNNLPIVLVEPSEGIYSSSGEAFIQAQRIYWKNNEQERKDVENTLNELLSNFNGQTYTVKTKSIFDTDTVENIRQNVQDDNNTLD